jgi:serine/threonine protein kinase
MTTCAKCHRDVVAGALFCGACGAPVAPERGPGDSADPYVGQRVKETYFIQRRIGGGGMGDVYQAVHVTLDKTVALKLLKKSLLADPALVGRFYREARAASKLQHPNVISVTDFGQTEDGTLFMAMEYLSGKNLARVIAEEQPLAEARVVHIGAQVLTALAEAHAAGILHRDLKPANVMIESLRDGPDSVKVLDFGIAKIQSTGSDAAESQPALTGIGLVCGTPGYMSPEQWNGEALDARSDLYSAGVLLYEMLTGQLPIQAATPMELARKQWAEQPRLPSAVRTGGAVSDDLERLVMRALATDRENRPASAEEMRSDLLACVLSPEPEAQAPATAGDRGGAGQTMALPRRTPSSPPGKRRTPGQGTGTRTPHKQPRSATPPNKSGPTNSTPPGSTTPPSGAGPRHEMDEPVMEPTRPQPIWLRRIGLTVGFAAGAGVLALATGLAYRVWRSPAPTPDASVARPPSPTPEPTLEPWLRSTPEPVLTAAPAPSPPPSPTPRPDPTPTPKLAIAPPPKPQVLCAAPLHVEHGLEKISAPPAGSGEGVLIVRALPWGEVSVCGEAYGEAPVELKVKAGTYRVRVEHGPTSAQRQVVVKPGAREAVAIDFLKEK